MSDQPIRRYTNTDLFNRGKDATPSIVTRNKDLIREQLINDVDTWLAQGNAITQAPPAVNDRNCRQVRVHAAGYFD